MNKKEIINAISVGEIFNNPGRGTSTIKSINENNIRYIRGNSTISIPTDVFVSVFNEFRGKICTSNDLKEYMPLIFSSKDNGHSCNCTFLFLVFNKMNMLKDGILGRGASGSPFYINFK